jgi:hypothetical protein
MFAKAATAPSPINYAFRPARFGPVWQFHLTPDSIAWEAGGRNGSVPYAEIRRVRLSFRPLTMQSHRFVAEIWPRQGRRLRLASSSWRIVDHERHDDAYASFIAELHRRLAAAGVRASFESGATPLYYWPGFAVFAAVAFAIAGLAVRALATGQVSAAAMMGALLAIFLWQAGAFFRRNRPGSYRADALPRDLLP